MPVRESRLPLAAKQPVPVARARRRTQTAKARRAKTRRDHREYVPTGEATTYAEAREKAGIREHRVTAPTRDRKKRKRKVRRWCSIDLCFDCPRHLRGSSGFRWSRAEVATAGCY